MILLVHVIIILVVIGLLLWCVSQIPGIRQPVLVAIEILIVLIGIIFILRYSGMAI